MNMIHLVEDKTRFINNLPWETEEEKNKVLDFFKSHANLESKIKSWQSKDKEATVQEIRNLISETNANSVEREKSKEGYRGNIDWEAHECRYLGEDRNWIYITPLSYEGAKFCDSAECGGGGAQWCIGYEQDDAYWNDYTNGGALFLMKYNKHPSDKQKNLKYMIEGYLGNSYVNIWNQTDNSRRYELSEKEKEYLAQIKKIQEEELKKKIKTMFDIPEPGVYIAKNIEAFSNIKDIKNDLKVFKVKEGLDCSSITNARDMFFGCRLLQSVDTSAFKNVTDTRDMFYGCRLLQSVDTSVFTNVRYSGRMFGECKSLQSVDTSSFINVTDADSMFYGCESLDSVDASIFKNVTNANSMFFNCKSLQSVDASAFTNVKDANCMFSWCESLQSIDNPSFTSVIDAIYMFYGCESLESIDSSSFINVKYSRAMFSGCKSLQSIDAYAFKNAIATDDMFKDCTNLKTYIPSSNPKVDSQLEELGAKLERSLTESSNMRYYIDSLWDF